MSSAQATPATTAPAPAAATPTPGAPPAGQPAPQGAAAAGAAPQGGNPGQPGARALSASLYIGDLDPDVGESLLFDMFKQVGPVASIRVCRDAVTRRSLGYAYVNFHNAGDAERAIDTLNYCLVKNRPCRIMWSHRDPSIRKSGVGNVFIKNLDASIDHMALYDTFSTFGNILSCKVVVDENGESKGYGFVHYETKEAADQAIAKVNGMLLNGKIVYVGQFIPKKDRKQVDPSETYTNIYVKNLDESVSDEEFNKIFRSFGDVTSAKLAMDENGKSKGFGFVNYSKHEDAVRAVEEMNEKKMESGKTLYVGRAEKKAEREAKLRAEFERKRKERLTKWQGVNLYIKNLDDQVDEEKLREIFAEFGNITSAKIMRDDKNNSKGFGFVCFTKPEEATKAVTEMNGRMAAGKPIYVALAQRKEIRKAQLDAQHAARANMRMQPQAAMGMAAPMYPGGAPAMFYPAQPGMPGPQQRGPYVYTPPQQIPGGMRRWPQQGPGGAQGGARPPAYQVPPNFVVPVRNQQRGGSKSQRGGNVPLGGVPGGSQSPARGGQNGRRGGNNGNYKFVNGGGRPDLPPMMPPMPMAPMGVPVQSGDGMLQPQEPFSSKKLSDASPEERKQILGDALYPMIVQQQHDVDLALKITGMILDGTDTSEVVLLLEDNDALNDKIQEAISVLQEEGDERPEEEKAQ